jgi:hypothetical protein
MSGSDVRVLEKTFSHAVVSGLAVTDLPIVTAAGVLQSSQGCIKCNIFGLDICDIPRNLRGLQRIHHPDGYVIPLSIHIGLPYMDMHPPTDLELETYPHVFFTSDTPQDSSNLNQEYPVEDLHVSTDDCIPSFGAGEVNNYGDFHTVLLWFNFTVAHLATPASY